MTDVMDTYMNYLVPMVVEPTKIGSAYPAARTRAREASFGRFRGRCLGRQLKTGVVLRRLLDLPRLPAGRVLRTAVPLLLILRTGGGTGTTFTSGLMRHNS